MSDHSTLRTKLYCWCIVVACLACGGSVAAIEIRPVETAPDSESVADDSPRSRKQNKRSKTEESVQQKRRKESSRMLNIGFVHDPGSGNYDAVAGKPTDLWNFVSVGTTAKDFLRYSDATASTARIRISQHDGAWGISDHPGIFHGYIYDNCQCKDLETTILDLEPGRYRAYVYAHGDAPDQNASIELIVAGKSIGKKATANDGTYRYRSLTMAEGVQYITFKFNVKSGQEVKFVSHRDGSSYSMFNAIQVVPLSAKNAPKHIGPQKK